MMMMMMIVAVLVQSLSVDLLSTKQNPKTVRTVKFANKIEMIVAK